MDAYQSWVIALSTSLVPAVADMSPNPLLINATYSKTLRCHQTQKMLPNPHPQKRSFLVNHLMFRNQIFTATRGCCSTKPNCQTLNPTIRSHNPTKSSFVVTFRPNFKIRLISPKVHPKVNVMALIRKIISIFGYLLYILRNGLLNITHLGKSAGWMGGHAGRKANLLLIPKLVTHPALILALT